MQKTIEQKLKQVVEQFEEQEKNDAFLAKLIDAQDNYNRLLKLGLTKSRGNTLVPLDEIHLHRFAFNTSF